MPEGTPVDRLYKKYRRQGMSEKDAAIKAQMITGLALATGKPPKHEHGK